MKIRIAFVIQHPRKRFCCPKISIPEVIALVPFENTVHASFFHQDMRFAYPVAHSRHNRIACFFLPVSKTEINGIGADHQIRKFSSSQILSHQNHALFHLKSEAFIELRQKSFRRRDEMHAHNTLLLKIGQKDFHQLFGDPFFLI